MGQETRVSFLHSEQTKAHPFPDALSGYQPRKSLLLRQAAAQAVAGSHQARDQHQQGSWLGNWVAIGLRRQLKQTVGVIVVNRPHLRAAVEDVVQDVGEGAAELPGVGGKDGELRAYRRIEAR